MFQLQEEVGVKESFRRTLVRSRLTWEWLTETANVLRVGWDGRTAWRENWWEWDERGEQERGMGWRRGGDGGVETGGGDGGWRWGWIRGVEMGGGDGGKTRLMMDEGKNKPRIRINASLTPDFRSKEGRNNCFLSTVNQTWCNRAWSHTLPLGWHLENLSRSWRLGQEAEDRNSPPAEE